MNLRTSLLCLLLSTTAYAQDSRISTEWLFAYYMPYDNNLSHFGDTIVTMIKRGITSNKVVATLQADYKGAGGMRRYIITSDTIVVSNVESESSSNTIEYLQYLDWVSQHIKHKRRAIVFLDHGGKLDELALDTHPQEKFFRIDSLSWVLTEFNKRSRHKSDLLYLQVCTKGSIEPLYEFRNCADFTLASQSELGAPNYYYEEMFELLSRLPSRSTRELANDIIRFETLDMYNSLTCIDNSKFHLFSRKLNALLALLESGPDVQFARREDYLLHYYGQSYYDLVGFFNSLEFRDRKWEETRNDLTKFITRELIAVYQIEESKHDKLKSFSGISLLNMSSSYPALVGEYAHLSFFRDFDMTKLYSSVFRKKP